MLPPPPPPLLLLLVVALERSSDRLPVEVPNRLRSLPERAGNNGLAPVLPPIVVVVWEGDVNTSTLVSRLGFLLLPEGTRLLVLGPREGLVMGTLYDTLFFEVPPWEEKKGQEKD